MLIHNNSYNHVKCIILDISIPNFVSGLYWLLIFSDLMGVSQQNGINIAIVKAISVIVQKL